MQTVRQLKVGHALLTHSAVAAVSASRAIHHSTILQAGDTEKRGPTSSRRFTPRRAAGKGIGSFAASTTNSPYPHQTASPQNLNNDTVSRSAVAPLRKNVVSANDDTSSGAATSAPFSDRNPQLKQTPRKRDFTFRSHQGDRYVSHKANGRAAGADRPTMQDSVLDDTLSLDDSDANDHHSGAESYDYYRDDDALFDADDEFPRLNLTYDNGSAALLRRPRGHATRQEEGEQEEVENFTTAELIHDEDAAGIGSSEDTSSETKRKNPKSSSRSPRRNSLHLSKVIFPLKPLVDDRCTREELEKADLTICRELYRAGQLASLTKDLNDLHYIQKDMNSYLSVVVGAQVKHSTCGASSDRPSTGADVSVPSYCMSIQLAVEILSVMANANNLASYDTVGVAAQWRLESWFAECAERLSTQGWPDEAEENNFLQKATAVTKLGLCLGKLLRQRQIAVQERALLLSAAATSPAEARLRVFYYHHVLPFLYRCFSFLCRHCGDGALGQSCCTVTADVEGDQSCAARLELLSRLVSNLNNALRDHLVHSDGSNVSFGLHTAEGLTDASGPAPKTPETCSVPPPHATVGKLHVLVFLSAFTKLLGKAISAVTTSSHSFTCRCAEATVNAPNPGDDILALYQAHLQNCFIEVLQGHYRHTVNVDAFLPFFIFFTHSHSFSLLLSSLSACVASPTIEQDRRRHATHALTVLINGASETLALLLFICFKSSMYLKSFQLSSVIGFFVKVVATPFAVNNDHLAEVEVELHTDGALLTPSQVQQRLLGRLRRRLTGRDATPSSSMTSKTAEAWASADGDPSRAVISEPTKGPLLPLFMFLSTSTVMERLERNTQHFSASDVTTLSGPVFQFLDIFRTRLVHLKRDMTRVTAPTFVAGADASAENDPLRWLLSRRLVDNLLKQCGEYEQRLRSFLLQRCYHFLIEAPAYNRCYKVKINVAGRAGSPHGKEDDSDAEANAHCDTIVMCLPYYYVIAHASLFRLSHVDDFPPTAHRAAVLRAKKLSQPNIPLARHRVLLPTELTTLSRQLANIVRRGQHQRTKGERRNVAAEDLTAHSTVETDDSVLSHLCHVQVLLFCLISQRSTYFAFLTAHEISIHLNAMSEFLSPYARLSAANSLLLECCDDAVPAVCAPSHMLQRMLPTLVSLLLCLLPSDEHASVVSTGSAESSYFEQSSVGTIQFRKSDFTELYRVLGSPSDGSVSQIIVASNCSDHTSERRTEGDAMLLSYGNIVDEFNTCLHRHRLQRLHHRTERASPREPYPEETVRKAPRQNSCDPLVEDILWQSLVLFRLDTTSASLDVHRYAVLLLSAYYALFADWRTPQRDGYRESCRAVPTPPSPSLSTLLVMYLPLLHFCYFSETTVESGAAPLRTDLPLSTQPAGPSDDKEPGRFSPEVYTWFLPRARRVLEGQLVDALNSLEECWGDDHVTFQRAVELNLFWDHVKLAQTRCGGNKSTSTVSGPSLAQGTGGSQTLHSRVETFLRSLLTRNATLASVCPSGTDDERQKYSCVRALELVGILQGHHFTPIKTHSSRGVTQCDLPESPQLPQWMLDSVITAYTELQRSCHFTVSSDEDSEYGVRIHVAESTGVSLVLRQWVVENNDKIEYLASLATDETQGVSRAKHTTPAQDQHAYLFNALFKTSQNQSSPLPPSRAEPVCTKLPSSLGALASFVRSLTVTGGAWQSCENIHGTATPSRSAVEDIIFDSFVSIVFAAMTRDNTEGTALSGCSSTENRASLSDSDFVAGRSYSDTTPSKSLGVSSVGTPPQLGEKQRTMIFVEDFLFFLAALVDFEFSLTGKTADEHHSESRMAQQLQNSDTIVANSDDGASVSLLASCVLFLRDDPNGRVFSERIRTHLNAQTDCLQRFFLRVSYYRSLINSARTPSRATLSTSSITANTQLVQIVGLVRLDSLEAVTQSFGHFSRAVHHNPTDEPTLSFLFELTRDVFANATLVVTTLYPDAFLGGFWRLLTALSESLSPAFASEPHYNTLSRPATHCAAHILHRQRFCHPLLLFLLKFMPDMMHTSHARFTSLPLPQSTPKHLRNYLRPEVMTRLLRLVIEGGDEYDYSSAGPLTMVNRASYNARALLQLAVMFKYCVNLVEQFLDAPTPLTRRSFIRCAVEGDALVFFEKRSSFLHNVRVRLEHALPPLLTVGYAALFVMQNDSSTDPTLQHDRETLLASLLAQPEKLQHLASKRSAASSSCTLLEYFTLAQRCVLQREDESSAFSEFSMNFNSALVLAFAFPFLVSPADFDAQMQQMCSGNPNSGWGAVPTFLGYLSHFHHLSDDAKSLVESRIVAREETCSGPVRYDSGEWRCLRNVTTFLRHSLGALLASPQSLLGVLGGDAAGGEPPTLDLSLVLRLAQALGPHALDDVLSAQRCVHPESLDPAEETTVCEFGGPHSCSTSPDYVLKVFRAVFQHLRWLKERNMPATPLRLSGVSDCLGYGRSEMTDLAAEVRALETIRRQSGESSEAVLRFGGASALPHFTDEVRSELHEWETVNTEMADLIFTYLFKEGSATSGDTVAITKHLESLSLPDLCSLVEWSGQRLLSSVEGKECERTVSSTTVSFHPRTTQQEQLLLLIRLTLEHLSVTCETAPPAHIPPLVSALICLRRRVTGGKSVEALPTNAAAAVAELNKVLSIICLVLATDPVSFSRCDLAATLVMLHLGDRGESNAGTAAYQSRWTASSSGAPSAASTPVQSLLTAPVMDSIIRAPTLTEPFPSLETTSLSELLRIFSNELRNCDVQFRKRTATKEKPALGMLCETLLIHLRECFTDADGGQVRDAAPSAETDDVVREMARSLRGSVHEYLIKQASSAADLPCFLPEEELNWIVFLLLLRVTCRS